MTWYSHFFNGLVQKAWKLAQSEEQTAHEVDFLYEMLELQPGRRVLDVFCGYGRHALELARLGCDVTGVDISAESIDELRATAGQENLILEARCGDFLTVPLPGSFDAAYCVGNSFSFFPHADMLAFLRRIAGQLQPGGRFVAETGMLAESVLPDFQERSWMKIEDITFLMENEYDVRESCVLSHLTYLHEGQTEQRLARHYLYTFAELSRLFEEAGLRITEAWSSLDGSEYVLGDDLLLLIAEKPD